MNTYILVLTLITSAGNGLGAGVTSLEMGSLKSCEAKGAEWVKAVGKEARFGEQNRSFFMCVEKGE